MNVETTAHLSANTLNQWRALIRAAGLCADEHAPRTVLVFDGDALVATGGRDGCVLKYIAVAPSHQGEDLTARVLSELRRDAFAEGHTHLFLYTKPGNRHVFSSLFFYPVVESANVLVMENTQGALADFLAALPPKPAAKTVGALVMNANPFTRGHQYLLERAAAECEQVFLFILSEEKSEFPAADRLEMARRGAAHLPNVTVLPSGPYLISSATFPTYFLKDRELAKEAACEVDVAIFGQHLAPRLGITHRFVGSEPHSPLTAAYNAALKQHLPAVGVAVRELPRLTLAGEPISASTVRALLKAGDAAALTPLLPDTTIDYLREKHWL